MSETQPFLSISRRPGPPLDRFVAQLWYWEGVPPAHARERLLPTASANLIVNLAEDEIRNYEGENDDQLERLPGAVLVGAYSRYMVIDSKEQEAVLGISFRPGGAWPFFDPACDEMHNRHAGLDDVWGRAGATLRERVLAGPTPHARLLLAEAELLARAIRPLERRPEISYALRHLSGATHGPSIASLSEQVGLNMRRFARLFEIEVGMTPKLYARITRFQRLLGMMDGAHCDWAQLAQQCGYFDQSHLIRDCKAISGFTPTELAARRTGKSYHVAL